MRNPDSKVLACNEGGCMMKIAVIIRDEFTKEMPVKKSIAPPPTY